MRERGRRRRGRRLLRGDGQRQKGQLDPHRSGRILGRRFDYPDCPTTVTNSHFIFDAIRQAERKAPLIP